MIAGELVGRSAIVTGGASGIGLAAARRLAPAGATVTVCSEPGGGAGEADLARSLPDGLAFDVAGALYVGCYEPSQVLRITPAGTPEVLLDDPEAHLLCHPTNLAFRGHSLLA